MPIAINSAWSMKFFCTPLQQCYFYSLLLCRRTCCNELKGLIRLVYASVHSRVVIKVLDLGLSTQICDYNSMRKGGFYEIFFFTFTCSIEPWTKKSKLFLASMGQLQSSKKVCISDEKFVFTVKLYTQSGLEKEVVQCTYF